MFSQVIAILMIVAGLGAILRGSSALRRLWNGQRHSLEFLLAELTVVVGFGLVGLAQIVRLLLTINGKLAP